MLWRTYRLLEVFKAKPSMPLFRTETDGQAT